MYKLIVHLTKSFETVADCKAEYSRIVDEMKKHDGLHVNGQIVGKFTGYSPEHPDGHEVLP